MTHPASSPNELINARLPRWLCTHLAHDWPTEHGQPGLADIYMANGLVTSIKPSDRPSTKSSINPVFATDASKWDLAGALVLPALVEAHTHLDKTFTLPRMGKVEPGLMGAIAAMMHDRSSWTTADVQQRAEQALQWAYNAGVSHLRTHCDWWEAGSTPLAWSVLGELALAWSARLLLERVSLMPLHLFTDSSTARALAARIAASGPDARMGGFIHTSNWNPEALRHLFESAARHGLDVDLHMDEELNPAACGLATTAALVKEMGFAGHVVCGHNCALSAQDELHALATLDAVAQARITLVTLPMTNLLLQDAVTGRTPRLRGITLLKEAKARGVNVLVASDNVQDPFCHVGSYDPLEAFAAGVLAGQLEEPFDVWSESLCRADWLHSGPAAPPLQIGSAADLLIFKNSSVWSFPSRSHERIVLRRGQTIGSQESPA